MNTDARFSGDITKKYGIFYLAVPYLLDIQKEAGKILKNYIAEHISRDSQEAITIYEGGCGTGTTTEILLETDTRIQVIAVDNEPAMLNQARERLESFKDRVTFIESDLLEAVKSFTDISIFVSGFTIHNLPLIYRANLFESLGRAMKPGGIFINADKIAQDDEKIHHDNLNTVLKMFSYFTTHGQPELEKQWAKHYLEDDKIRLTEKELKEGLEKNNFKDIQFLFRQYTDAIVVAYK